MSVVFNLELEKKVKKSKKNWYKIMSKIIKIQKISVKYLLFLNDSSAAVL